MIVSIAAPSSPMSHGLRSRASSQNHQHHCKVLPVPAPYVTPALECVRRFQALALRMATLASTPDTMLWSRDHSSVWSRHSEIHSILRVGGKFQGHCWEG